MSVGARYYGGETDEKPVVSECMRLRWRGAGAEAVGETRVRESACDYGVRWSPAGRFSIWAVPGPSRRGGTLAPHWYLTGASSVSAHSARRVLVPMARPKRTLGAWRSPGAPCGCPRYRSDRCRTDRCRTFGGGLIDIDPTGTVRACVRRAPQLSGFPA